MQLQTVRHQMHQNAALRRHLESLDASLCLHDRPPQLLVDQHRMIVFDLKSPVQPAENMNCSRLVIRPSTIHHSTTQFPRIAAIFGTVQFPNGISFSEKVSYGGRTVSGHAWLVKNSHQSPSTWPTSFPVFAWPFRDSSLCVRVSRLLDIC